MGKIKVLDYLLNYYKDKNYPNLEESTANPIKKIKNSIMKSQWKQKKEAIFNGIYSSASKEVKGWIQTQRECIQIQKHINTTKKTKKAML